MNLHVGFRKVVRYSKSDGNAVVRVAAASVYRLFVNGVFAGYGPARATPGYARVDEWPIAQFLHDGANLIAVEVAGYNVNSFYLPRQAAFLQAEVVCDGKVLAATGADNEFEAIDLSEYVRKTQRYSFQRPFTEVYRLAPQQQRWRSDPNVKTTLLRLSTQPQRLLLPRRVPLPDFTVYPAQTLVAEGSMERGSMPSKPWRDRSLTQVPVTLDGYPEAEIPELPSLELQRWRIIDR